MTAGNPDFDQLLDYLLRTRGFDFSAYKRPSLERRLMKRMGEVGIADAADYIDRLEVEPEEFERLFNTILINVTAFFRDPEAWAYLADEILPRLRDASDDHAIRVWIPGCSTGEEVYTLAVLLAEAFGVEAFAERVKIYATDIDDEALIVARQARYAPKDIEPVPEHLRKTYFEPSAASVLFRQDLRRGIVFGRHNLLTDAPMSRLDLLMCRNTLMYFNADAQSDVLAKMHFALNDTGFLFLGRAEMLLSRTDTFVPESLKARVFAKVPSGDRQGPARGDPPKPQELNAEALWRAAVDASPAAQVVVDGVGALAFANARAQDLFSLTEGDAGRPFKDLEVSYRPLELRSQIEKVRALRRPVHITGIEQTTAAGELRSLDIDVSLLSDASGSMLGVCITFTDTTPSTEMQKELGRAKQELDTAYEELQSSNEELETTNEELQSTVEELETTNEELQATNEELETMNEELQSTNAELQAMNDELNERGEQVKTSEAFLGSILASVRASIIVLDGEMRVRRWSGRSEELWGMRADEVEGTPMFGLDIGLPFGELAPYIKATLGGEASAEPITISATNRRGKQITCSVMVTPLLGQGSENVVLVIQEQPSVDV